MGLVWPPAVEFKQVCQEKNLVPLAGALLVVLPAPGVCAPAVAPVTALAHTGHLPPAQSELLCHQGFVHGPQHLLHKSSVILYQSM